MCSFHCKLFSTWHRVKLILCRVYSLWILNVQIWVSTTTLRIQDNFITPKTPAFHPFQSHTPPPTTSELDNHQPVLHRHKFTFSRGSYKRNCSVCNLWDRLFHSAQCLWDSPRLTPSSLLKSVQLFLPQRSVYPLSHWGTLGLFPGMANYDQSY